MRKIVCVTMKSVACAVMAAGMIGQAEAADYLRGIFETAPPPPPPEWISDDVDWAGIYGGAFVGGSSLQIKQKVNKLTLLNEALPGNPLGSQLVDIIRYKDKTPNRLSGGAFLGYNMVWDDVVLGLEADYSHSQMKGTSLYTEQRKYNHPTNTARYYTVRTESRSEAHLKDWMTLRGRVGWAAGNFMPFVTVGVALGNLKSSYSSAFNLTEYENIGCASAPCLVSAGTRQVGTIKQNGMIYGAALGAGLDFAFAKNFFVRAEWQYIQFASKQNRPDLSVNTLRLAGAMKF